MRSVAEWVATHDDQAIPPRVRLRVFERYEGKCQCGCGLKIVPPGDKWDCDHKQALINGGAHREGNLQPLLVAHHRKKSRDDMTLKTFNYRRRLAHAGIKQKRRPMPGSRDSPWKVTFGRGVVRR